MKIKRTLSLILAVVLVVSFVGVFGASAQSSSASMIPTMVSENQDSLQEDLLWAKGNDAYEYTGYRGLALSGWAKKYANMAVLLGLMPDEVSDYFAEPISRRDFAILAERYLGAVIQASTDELIGLFGTKSFSDCDRDEVRLCAALGIIGGYPDGTFRPNNSITRQEAATMLSRLSMLTGCYASTYNGEFNDGSGLWGEKYIANTSKLKDPFMNASVMNGLGSGVFGPNESYTREQALVTIIRLLGATTACHTGYSGIQPSPFALPRGTYYRNDNSSRLTISYSGSKVNYKLVSNDTGSLKGTSESGTVYYDVYTDSLKGSESEIFFTLQSDFSIRVKTDWLDEMYSVYNLFDGVYGGSGDPSDDIPPSPTPTPDDDTDDANDNSGKKLPGDDGATLDLQGSVLSAPIDYIEKIYPGPFFTPENPDETTKLLQGIKDGTKRFDYSFATEDGSLMLAYRYWGTRAQLESYCKGLLEHYDISASYTNTKNAADYMAGGAFIGTKLNAACGKPLFGAGTLSFSNDESGQFVIPNTSIYLQIDNVGRRFSLVSSLDKSNIGTTTKKQFLAIDPENHLIVCYDYDDDVEGFDWMADCWALLADVNSDGDLVLKGIFAESFSSGMRMFCKAEYTVSVSDA